MKRALLTAALILALGGAAASLTSLRPNEVESLLQSQAVTPPPVQTPPLQTAESLERPGTPTPPNARSQPPNPVNPQAAAAQDLVWGKDASTANPSWAMPPVNGTWVDQTYGTLLRRLTSADGTRFNRNTYSRRQAENATGTMFFTYHGEAEYRVYNRRTTNLVRALDMHPDAEPQWHPTNPNLVRFISGPGAVTGGLALYETHVHTGETTVIADLATRIQAAVPAARYMLDRAEGSPSMDGSRYAWILYNSNGDTVGVVSYDLATDTILGLSDQLHPTAQNLDWVSFSPTGQYVMAGYWDGTFVYNANLTNERLVVAGGEHSDIALNAPGSDAYVYIDFTAGPNAGWLVSVDLDTLATTRIFDAYDDANTSIHVSGKGYNKPGWVVVSTYNCKDDGAWSCEKVMAVELQPNGRILMLAHTHNCGNEYWTETHAVINRSFTRVYFNTDSGSCGMDAEVVEITVPPFR